MNCFTLLDEILLEHVASCTTTTSRTQSNIKGMSQRSRSHRFMCVSCVHVTGWTSWPGFTKCHLVDGATSLLPGKRLALLMGST